MFWCWKNDVVSCPPQTTSCFGSSQLVLRLRLVLYLCSFRTGSSHTHPVERFILIHGQIVKCFLLSGPILSKKKSLYGESTLKSIITDHSFVPCDLIRSRCQLKTALLYMIINFVSECVYTRSLVVLVNYTISPGSFSIIFKT